VTARGWAAQPPGAWLRFRSIDRRGTRSTDTALKEKGAAGLVVRVQTFDKVAASNEEEMRIPLLAARSKGKATLTLGGKAWACDVQEEGEGPEAIRSWTVHEGRFAGAVLRRETGDRYFQAKTLREGEIMVKDKAFACLVAEGEEGDARSSRNVAVWLVPSLPTGFAKRETDEESTELVDFGADWATRPLPAGVVARSAAPAEAPVAEKPAGPIEPAPAKPAEPVTETAKADPAKPPLEPGAEKPVEPAKPQEPPAQEPPAQEQPTKPLDLGQKEVPWLDFGWVDLQTRLGLAVFSDDYHIDPSPFFSLHAHVPLPWLSPGSNEEGEYFGLFSQFAFVPKAERTLDPEPDQPTGSIFFWAIGADFTILRNQSLLLMLEGGWQYASYGGITNLNDGFNSMAGVTGGVYLGGKMTLTFGGDWIFAHAGDHVILGYLGLLIEF
jgi:hypothetical protein